MPSKKVIFAAIIIGLGFGGWFWLTRIKNSAKPQVTNSRADNSLKNQASAAEKDSDNDGLKDWEEILWKTDPNNPDSDKDGTPDGKEVEESRDPTKKGPDDKLVVSPLKTGGESQNSESLTATEEIAQRFLSDYLSMKSGGETLNQSEKETLVNNFLQDTTNTSLKDAYALKDLKINPSFSKEKIKSFFNETAGIINKHFSNLDEDELQIIISALRNQDEKKLGILGDYERAYKESVKEILPLAVPGSYAVSHLEFINIINNVGRSVAKIKGFFNDPIQALAGLKEYSDQADRYKIWRKNVIGALKNDGIVFENSDSAMSLFITY